MNLGEELQRLEELHRAGTLSDSEFEAAKAALINNTPERPPPVPPAPVAPVTASIDPARRTKEAREMAVWMHLSLLAGFVVPYAGFAVPIIIWQLKKEDFPEIEPHGKAIANWLISKTIYAAVCVPLIFLCVGIFLLIGLGIIAIIYPIIGAVKAGKNEVWDYPGSIPFFR